MSGLNLWRGLFPATVLPFDEDYRIDQPELRALIRFLLDVRGVAGLACNGHAGDCWALTREERRQVIEVHVEEAEALLPAPRNGVATSRQTAAQSA